MTEPTDNLGPDLSAYLDGELPEARVREVEQILDQRPEARALLGELRKAARDVKALPRLAAPPDLSQALRGRLPRPTARTAAALSAGRILRVAGRVSAAAAVLGAAVLAGWQMGRTGHQPATTESPLVTRTLAPPAAPAPESDTVADKSFQPHSELRLYFSAPRAAPSADVFAAERPAGTAPSAAEEDRQSAAGPAWVAASAGAAGERSAAAELERVEPATVAVPPAAVRGAADPRPVAAGYALEPPALPEGPTIRVWVIPEDPAQYRAALALLHSVSTADAGKFGTPEDLLAEAADVEPVELVRTVSRADASVLLATLQHELPDRMFFELQGRGTDLPVLSDLSKPLAAADLARHQFEPTRLKGGAADLPLSPPPAPPAAAGRAAGSGSHEKTAKSDGGGRGKQSGAGGKRPARQSTSEPAEQNAASGAGREMARRRSDAAARTPAEQGFLRQGTPAGGPPSGGAVAAPALESVPAGGGGRSALSQPGAAGAGQTSQTMAASQPTVLVHVLLLPPGPRTADVPASRPRPTGEPAGSQPAGPPAR